MRTMFGWSRREAIFASSRNMWRKLRSVARWGSSRFTTTSLEMPGEPDGRARKICPIPPVASLRSSSYLPKATAISPPDYTRRSPLLLELVSRPERGDRHPGGHQGERQQHGPTHDGREGGPVQEAEPHQLRHVDHGVEQADGVPGRRQRLHRVED